MRALIQRLKKEEKGLTLIELLAVIVIIGIIAAIAVPIVTGLINDTKNNARVATANQLLEAAKLYSIANNGGVIAGDVTLKDLVEGEYIQDNLTDPKEGTAYDDEGTKIDLDSYMSAGNAVVVLEISGGDTFSYSAKDLKSEKTTTSGSGSESSGSGS
ncbi:prepilin-type N-terminal cleavage/methylation domain-containing protein [Paenibacillus sp. M1]|uniref:Prepilin-type N-terminal cleavage/methylation domain-containing protein n=1 Tax=Paenibacillus haidiansis TaxID=1574488 RepID=A0ABU7VRF9_9BACL